MSNENHKNLKTDKANNNKEVNFLRKVFLDFMIIRCLWNFKIGKCDRRKHPKEGKGRYTSNDYMIENSWCDWF